LFGVTEASLAASAKRSLRVGQGDFELLVLRPKLAVLLGQAELVVDTSSLLRGQFLPQLLDMRPQPLIRRARCALLELLDLLLEGGDLGELQGDGDL